MSLFNNLTTKTMDNAILYPFIIKMLFKILLVRNLLNRGIENMLKMQKCKFKGETVAVNLVHKLCHLCTHQGVLFTGFHMQYGSKSIRGTTYKIIYFFSKVQTSHLILVAKRPTTLILCM